MSMVFPPLELLPPELAVLLLLLLLPQAARINTAPTSTQAIIALPSIRMLLLYLSVDAELSVAR
jgi:hypothetical protein